MSKENKEGAPAEPKAPKAKPPLTILLLATNLIAALGAVGTVVYTKVLYKRPVITESSEREKLSDKMKAKRPVGPPGSLIFPPVTVNLDPAAADQGGQGKLHFATIGFTMATIDKEAESKLQEIRPLIEDKLLTLVGKRGYQDLTSVQGRYLLRSQLRESANQAAKEALVTDVYFTEFTVQ
ncbi:MAG: flagellar basal body-associated FliL family protein [Bdellovibrionales bacterium]|nr:flagellar basal body-associated FliL family protein [Bdellovibrionales bacterium]